ncbi:MAG: hypothetical protein LBT17_02870, partial [Mycoplasmataceae bacterium]|nr:hypothetical protein [Mycoplasmataceae bacterium]
MNTTNNVISLEVLFELAKRRNALTYFYILRKNVKKCFTGNYLEDIRQANTVILSKDVSNNTGHSKESAFNWLYDQYYGQNHNHKLLAHRSWEVSKLTTRLDVDQIRHIDGCFGKWVGDTQAYIPNGR